MSSTLQQYQKLRETADKNTSEFLRHTETSTKFSSSDEKKTFLSLLLSDLKNPDWNESIKTQALSTIRVLGRDPTGSDPLFEKEGIQTLVEQAFGTNDTTTSREALKCIANCIQLQDTVKTYLNEKNVVEFCHQLLQSKEQLSMESQFLSCRIIFFMTVNRLDLVTKLIDSGIANAIEKVLIQNISVLENEKATVNMNQPINQSSVTVEALKLLFNLLLVSPHTAEHAHQDAQVNNNAAEKFENCLVPIFHLLINVPQANPQPLVPPTSQAVHALMQFPYTSIAKVWKAQSKWTSKHHTSSDQGHAFLATTLVGLLDRAIHVLIPKGDPDDIHDSNGVDATLSPVVLVLRSLAEGDDAINKAIGKKMLPNEKDRLKPVHEGFSLPAYLIRLMTSTMMPLTRDGVCETLYVLCNKDATKFTQQVGYGNAVGFLVNKGIAMEPPKGEEQEEQEFINPITGQYVKEEKAPDLKDMTDEEKEREAERLFVLFERLKKTGIIDVENPIAKAMQESQGRFEEINSSDEESD